MKRFNERIVFLFLLISNFVQSKNFINSRGFSRKINPQICPQPPRQTVPTIHHTNKKQFIKYYREISPVILSGGTLNWPSVLDGHKDQFTWDFLHNRWSPRNLTTGNSINLVSKVGSSRLFTRISLSDQLDDMFSAREKSNSKSTAIENTLKPTRYQTKPMDDGDTPNDEPMYTFHRGLWKNWNISSSHNLSTSVDPVRSKLQQTCTPVSPFVKQSPDEVQYIFGIGGPSSGTTLHRHGETWLHMIEGTKRIILYSPSKLPPLQYSSEISQRDWIKHVYELGLDYVRSEECQVKRGDILYIPSGWFHATINCDETIALALQPTPSETPLGTTEIQIEMLMRKNSGKIPAKLLDSLYQRWKYLSPNSPTLNILWSEANFRIKSNKMRRYHTAVKFARKARDISPHTASAHLGVAHSLVQRVRKRIDKYNITEKNAQLFVNDFLEMVNAMNKALQLDHQVTKVGGKWVANSIFQLFDLLENVIPKLGSDFVLDVGLDIVEEKARKSLQTASLVQLQRSIDAQACLWKEEYKWYLPKSSDGKPRNLKYFVDHQNIQYWKEAETPVVHFARKLKEIGGSNLTVYGPPKKCNKNSTRKQMLVKDLL